MLGIGKWHHPRYGNLSLCGSGFYLIDLESHRGIGMFKKPSTPSSLAEANQNVRRRQKPLYLIE